MGKKIMITCDEATTICDKKQYGEAGLADRLRLNLHLLLCKHCRAYSMQNNYISKLLSKYLKHKHTHKHLDAHEKVALENEIKIKIKELSGTEKP